MAFKTTIQDDDGNTIYPVTLTEAVQDDNGITAKEKFGAACYIASDDSDEVDDPIDIDSNKFNTYDEFENIQSGEAKSTIFGKIARWFQEIDNKLNKTAVVNNQVTTEEGKALDARQANASIEGTLGNQISKLNESMIYVKFTQSITYNTTLKYDSFTTQQVIPEGYELVSAIAYDSWAHVDIINISGFVRYSESINVAFSSITTRGASITTDTTFNLLFMKK